LQSLHRDLFAAIQDHPFSPEQKMLLMTQLAVLENEELMRFYAPQVARATTTTAATETAEMSVAVGPSMAQELIDIFSTLNMALRDVLTSEEE
jgi:hypothetical protein